MTAPHVHWMNTPRRNIESATPYRPDHSLWPALRLIGAVLLLGVAVGVELVGVAL